MLDVSLVYSIYMNGVVS